MIKTLSARRQEMARALEEAEDLKDNDEIRAELFNYRRAIVDDVELIMTRIEQMARYPGQYRRELASAIAAYIMN